jgi:hypothetical protein
MNIDLIEYLKQAYCMEAACTISACNPSDIASIFIHYKQIDNENECWKVCYRLKNDSNKYLVTLSYPTNSVIEQLLSENFDLYYILELSLKYV